MKDANSALAGVLTAGIVAVAVLSIARKGRQRAALSAMTGGSPTRFEELVAEHFRTKGYRVEPVGGPGDGGVDLVLWKFNKRYIVQAKRLRWNVNVNPDAVKAFCLMVKREHAFGGFFVTTGRVSRAMRQLARSMRVHVIDRATIDSYAYIVRGAR